MTKKKLMFAQIAPFWNEALKKKLEMDVGTGNIIAQIGKEIHDLNNFSCCIVGEAHGFNDNYKYCCWHCAFFSREFHAKYGAKEVFNELKRNFVNHWNEQHS